MEGEKKQEGTRRYSGEERDKQRRGWGRGGETVERRGRDEEIEEETTGG